MLPTKNWIRRARALTETWWGSNKPSLALILSLQKRRGGWPAKFRGDSILFFAFLVFSRAVYKYPGGQSKSRHALRYHFAETFGSSLMKGNTQRGSSIFSDTPSLFYRGENKKKESRRNRSCQASLRRLNSLQASGKREAAFLSPLASEASANKDFLKDKERGTWRVSGSKREKTSSERRRCRPAFRNVAQSHHEMRHATTILTCIKNPSWIVFSYSRVHQIKKWHCNARHRLQIEFQVANISVLSAPYTYTRRTEQSCKNMRANSWSEFVHERKMHS